TLDAARRVYVRAYRGRERIHVVDRVERVCARVDKLGDGGGAVGVTHLLPQLARTLRGRRHLYHVRVRAAIRLENLAGVFHGRVDHIEDVLIQNLTTLRHVGHVLHREDGDGPRLRRARVQAALILCGRTVLLFALATVRVGL